MLKINKVMVPTDFSQESLKALRYATEFASSLLAAEILVVHVMEPPVYPAMNFAGAANVPSFYDELRQACAERLDKLVKDEIPEGIEARAIMRDGRPFAELVETAGEEEVDLIIVATHGHTGHKHLMLGSTAEKIVRTAPCPVLTVRDSEREFVRG